jgi:hypothetical protein
MDVRSKVYTYRTAVKWTESYSTEEGVASRASSVRPL